MTNFYNPVVKEWRDRDLEVARKNLVYELLRIASVLLYQVTPAVVGGYAKYVVFLGVG